MKKYEGSLNIKKMNPIQKKAYKAWKDQRQRCSNPNDPRYYAWGARGIRVEYGSREFIAWWELEYSKKMNWKRAQCGRIDHNKNYSLDNIELVECSDNVKERNERNGNPSPSKLLRAISTQNNEVKIFPSKREAARILGISRNCIKNQLSGPTSRKPSCGWIFEEVKINQTT